MFKKALLFRGTSFATGLFITFGFPYVFGMTAYGAFSYTMAVVGLIGLLFTGGLPQSTFETIIKKEMQSSLVLGINLKILVITIVLTLLASKVQYFSSFITPIPLLTAAIFSWSIILSSTLRARNQINAALTLELIHKQGLVATYILVAFFFTFESQHVYSFLIISNIILLTYIHLHFNLTISLKKVSRKLRSTYLKLAYSYVLYLAFFTTMRNIDVIFLERAVSLEQVGIYKIVVTMGFLLTTVFGTIETLSQNKLIDIQLFYRDGGRSLERRAFQIILLLALALSIISPALLREVYKIEFDGVYVYFFANLAMHVIVAWFGFFTSILNLNGYKSYFIKCALFCLIVNVIGNYLLISRYEELGAVITTALAMLILCVLSYLKIRKILCQNI
jgi:O-antigen/teichoic acid export membrane protein